jgi:mRNA-degrading endonuclease RelE of RelBE toxin-antitoxin system
MYRVQIHDLAKDDIQVLKKAGKRKIADRAVTKINMIATLKDPTEHNNVTILDEDAPGWFRYKDGDMRIIFRFTKSGIEVIMTDVIEITMLAQRNEKTYGRELQRRYRLLEGKTP